MPRLYQGAFSGGEGDPGVWGRVDLERYASMVRTGRNVIFLPEGGAIKRPGFEFVGFQSLGALGVASAVRPIPFEFNNEQTYTVYAGFDRCYFAKNGGVILRAREGVVDMANPATVGVDANGPYVNFPLGGMTYAAGDTIVWLSGGYEELQARWLRVAAAPAPTANRIYFLDFVTGVALPSSGFTAASGAIDFGEVYTLTTANGWYAALIDPMELDFTQANDKLYISHPSAKTKVLTRTSDTSWTITDFDPAPTNAAPSVAESASSNPPPGTRTIEYAVTSIETDTGTYEESLADLFEISSVDPDLLNASPDFVELEWAHVAGNDEYRVYKATAGIYGLIGTAKGTSGTITFRDIGYTPNLTFAPPLEADIFNAAGSYPGAVELAQQRIWFGRTDSLLRDVYASRAGSLSSFATSTVGTDEDPIELAIAAKSVNEVRHFVPMKDLVILTSHGEWGFDTGDEGAVSPRSGLIAHSFWGSTRVKPALVGESALFVERTGRSVRDLAFALQNDGFASSNLTLFVKHLFQGREVVDMCFSQSPFNVLFCVMSDGQGLLCTYVRDQQIFAWSRVETSGRIKACASVTEDGRDNIYTTIERVNIATGAPYLQIERMVVTDPGFVEQGLWMDNALDVAEGALTGCQIASTVTETVNGAPVLSLRLRMNSATFATGDLVKLTVLAGSAFSSIADITVRLEKMGDVSGGLESHKLYRVVNGDAATATLLDMEGLLPPDTTFTGSPLCYASPALTELDRAPHLMYRGTLPAIRRDTQMSTGVSIPLGSASWVGAAGRVQVGELYTCEIETLDIDSASDPVTGLPAQLGEVLIRFAAAAGFQVGRRRGFLANAEISTIRQLDDYNASRGFFRGVMPASPFPDWRRDGRLVIRSQDAFPFVLSALVPVVEVGTLDAE